MPQKDRRLMERIREFVNEYARDHYGQTPSTTKIAERFGICRSGAFGYLKAMDQAGMIRYENGQIITDFMKKFNSRGPVGYAFAEGTITAGTPIEIETYAEDIFEMPPVFVDGKSGTFFVLTVKGDSMVDAGIRENDLVLCQAQETAKKGDIVAAYIPGEGATLKRYCINKEGPYLWAENKGWRDQKRNFGREFIIQGVAIKVLKDIHYKEAEREDNKK